MESIKKQLENDGLKSTLGSLYGNIGTLGNLYNNNNNRDRNNRKAIHEIWRAIHNTIHINIVTNIENNIKWKA